MDTASELSKIISDTLSSNERTSIIYHYDEGVLELDKQTYEVGRLSFSQVADAVLGSLKQLYGEYKTIPYAFNTEAYENEHFKAEVLALGGLGLLEFSVHIKKQVAV